MPTTKVQIPLFKVHSPPNIGTTIQKVFDSGMLTEGHYSDQFEKLFSSFIENPHTSLVNSCTSALMLACDMAGFSAEDEVISSPMTCLASNIPIAHTKAKIVWADIDPTTGNISPQSVRKRINKKTKGIVAVHWAGQPFDLDAINDIANEHGLTVIEDAAHALGAQYSGKPIGSHSDFVCFSFQAIKHLTTADGGAICSKSSVINDEIRLKRWFGLDRHYPGTRWEQDVTHLGYKFHMNNLNAAIGIEQMKDIDRIIQKHQDNGRYYDENIHNPLITKLRRDPKASSAHWIYSILCQDRFRLQKYLADHGIATDVVHIRNDHYTLFEDCKRSDLPGLELFSSQLLNIPVGWWISEVERELVVEVLNAYR